MAIENNHKSICHVSSFAFYVLNFMFLTTCAILQWTSLLMSIVLTLEHFFTALDRVGLWHSHKRSKKLDSIRNDSQRWNARVPHTSVKTHIYRTHSLFCYDVMKTIVAFHFTGSYEHYSTMVPQVVAGDADVLDKVIQDHISGENPLNNIRSRYTVLPLLPPPETNMPILLKVSDEYCVCLGSSTEVQPCIRLLTSE